MYIYIYTSNPNGNPKINYRLKLGDISSSYIHERCMKGKCYCPVIMSIGIADGHDLIEEAILSTVLNQIEMCCYLVLFHVSVRVHVLVTSKLVSV